MSEGLTKISVVTPTFRRPGEVVGLFENLKELEVMPDELVLVDGAASEEDATEKVVKDLASTMPFKVVYERHQGGTAIQRNRGIELASGDLIAFIDDDVRLDPAFFSNVVGIFEEDREMSIGGVVGYRKNRFFPLEGSSRWRWYKKLGLLKVFEPGRYDFECGYPINSNMQPEFQGTRQVDFMTTACAVWRREVTDSGLRFDPFFRDYGVLEDAHFSLRAGRSWKLLQSGDALCEELHSPNGREPRRKIGYKCVVNYYFVFNEISKPLTLPQKFRFWRYQAFELFRVGSSAIRRRSRADLDDVIGRFEGILAVTFGSAK